MSQEMPQQALIDLWAKDVTNAEIGLFFKCWLEL